MANKKSGLDKSVIIIGVAFLVLALVVILLRFLLSSHGCPETFGFSTSKDNAEVGEAITFSDTTVGAKDWKWDFGDSSSPGISKTVTHSYKSEGEYKVTLYINEGKCESLIKNIKINVHQGVAPAAIQQLPTPQIEAPKGDIIVGKPVKFKGSCPDCKEVTSWAWDFGENGKTDATTEEATYTFMSAGTHTVTLMVNGNSQLGHVSVSVKNPLSGGGHGTIPEITEGDFMKLLNDYVNNEHMTIEALFSKWLCGQLDLKIHVNSDVQQFDTFCTGLRLTGIQDVESIKLTKDPKTHCVTDIEVKMK